MDDAPRRQGRSPLEAWVGTLEFTIRHHPAAAPSPHDADRLRRIEDELLQLIELVSRLLARLDLGPEAS